MFDPNSANAPVSVLNAGMTACSPANAVGRSTIYLNESLAPNTNNQSCQATFIYDHDVGTNAFFGVDWDEAVNNPFPLGALNSTSIAIIGNQGDVFDQGAQITYPPIANGSTITVRVEVVSNQRVVKFVVNNVLVHESSIPNDQETRIGVSLLPQTCVTIDDIAKSFIADDPAAIDCGQTTWEKLS